MKRANSNEKEEDNKQQNKLQNIKRKWMLLTVDGRDYYVSRKDPSLKHLFLEELFDVMYTEHLAIGHYSRDKLNKELRKKYGNITLSSITHFISLCIECVKKKKKNTTANLPTKPLRSTNYLSR